MQTERTWLETIMKQTSDGEAPPEFFYWAGLAAISAVVKKKVYLDRHLYKLYPNIYAILIAKSGDRKSLPIALAKNLVHSVGNTRIISGSASIQAMIAKLSKIEHLESGEQLTTGCAFLVSEEFTNLIIDDPRAFNILTDLYDTHAYNKIPWTNTLKVAGEERIKEPYLTMFGASNEPLWNEKIPESSIGGGFIGRTLLIKSKKRGKPNSLARKPENTLNYDALVPYLREVASLEGTFQYDTEETIEFFDQWYNEHYNKFIEDDTGASNRLADNILKVSMLLSLSQSTSLVITREHLEQAMDACYGFAVNVRNTVEGRGKAKHGESIKFILMEMLKKGPEGPHAYTISKVELLRRYYSKFDAADLIQIEETMLSAGMIARSMVDNKACYTLTELMRNRLESLQRE